MWQAETRSTLENVGVSLRSGREGGRVHICVRALETDAYVAKRATRMEARKQDQRPVPKTYYYLDYKEFVDVVKWKMYKMQTIVRDNLRTVSIGQ